VQAARASYPGYLAVRSDLYAAGWAEVHRSRARGVAPGQACEAPAAAFPAPAVD
jgi:hypothetical protein